MGRRIIRFWVIAEWTFIGALSLLSGGALIKALGNERLGTIGNALVIGGLAVGIPSLVAYAVGHARKVYQ